MAVPTSSGQNDTGSRWWLYQPVVDQYTAHKSLSRDDTYIFLGLPAGHEVVVNGRHRLPPRAVEDVAAMLVLHVTVLTRCKHRAGVKTPPSANTGQGLNIPPQQTQGGG